MAMSPKPNSTNLSIPENNNISISPGNTTINTWTELSPKKKRPKKGQTQEAICLLVPEKFDHPQPVSKRISFGLPPNNPYLKPASNTQIPPPPCQTNILKDTKTNNTSNGPTASITQSYLKLRIDLSSTSLSDINTIQMVRSVIKIILQSKTGLSVVPPSHQEVPTIFGNCELPERSQTRSMRRYVHQGRMLPTSFSGKILVHHPVDHVVLSSKVLKDISSNYPTVQISLDKFGVSKIINVGVLCGTFPQESRNAMSKSLEAMVSKEGNQTLIPIAVKWDKIYSNGNQPKSTEAMFLKCKLEDAAWVTSALSCHYGSTVADRDSLRPLVRFISMATLKSSDTVTTQVISRQHKFLNSIHTVSIQNLKPVDCLIQGSQLLRSR